MQLPRSHAWEMGPGLMTRVCVRSGAGSESSAHEGATQGQLLEALEQPDRHWQADMTLRTG